MAKLDPRVDKAKCIGSGDCIETAPAVFAFDDQGKSCVIDPAGAPDATVLLAARSCPVKAITVVDQESRQQLYPLPRK